MKLLHLLAAVFLLAPLTMAGSSTPAAGQCTERAINLDTNNLYPRWLPWVAVSPYFSPTRGYTNIGTSDISVATDSRNYTHVALASGASNPNLPPFYITDGLYMQIYYKNDHIESRLINGFSNYVTLASTQQALINWHNGVVGAPQQYLSSPDIFVDSQDNIHVAWLQMTFPTATWLTPGTGGSPATHTAGPGDHWDIYYTKKTATGWQPPVMLTTPGS